MLTVLIPVKVKVAKYKCPPEIEWALCQDGDAVDTSFLEVIQILYNTNNFLVQTLFFDKEYTGMQYTVMYEFKKAFKITKLSFFRCWKAL